LPAWNSLQRWIRRKRRWHVGRARSSCAN